VIALARIGPDIIGVRTVVCGGDRLLGTVSASKVKVLKEILDRSRNEREAGALDWCLSAKGKPAFPDIAR
jgi:hypothetical protein